MVFNLVNNNLILFPWFTTDYQNLIFCIGLHTALHKISVNFCCQCSFYKNSYRNAPHSNYPFLILSGLVVVMKKCLFSIFLRIRLLSQTRKHFFQNFQVILKRILENYQKILMKFPQYFMHSNVIIRFNFSTTPVFHQPRKSYQVLNY